MNRTPRPRKCECGCGVRFTPSRPFETWSSIECGLKVAQDRLKKKERKEIQEKKAATRKIQYYLKRTEKAVNAFVRERDREQSCISCGTNDAAKWHAGHWKSVGANSSLRFDPSNIHRQCDQCNVFKGGNATEYEARLPARIGQDEFERLKYAPKVRKWTREECQAIEAEYKLKLKELKERSSHV